MDPEGNAQSLDPQCHSYNIGSGTYVQNYKRNENLCINNISIGGNVVSANNSNVTINQNCQNKVDNQKATTNAVSSSAGAGEAKTSGPVEQGTGTGDIKTAPPEPTQGKCPDGMYEYNLYEGGFCCPVKPQTWNNVTRLVSSDSLENPMIKNLSEKYNLKIFNSSPIDTIIIGSEYEYRVLSNGSFSWMIGYLGDNNKVFCPTTLTYHGDMFVYPEWNYF